MLFFMIELDEEQIKKDRIINLDAAHRTIENTFAQRNVTLYHKEGTVRYYTRDIDDHDFEYLWMVNAPFRYESWFQYYVKQWKYIETDDDTNEIDYEEDITDEWVSRPEKP